MCLETARWDSATPEPGGRRRVVPRRYFWKSAKWIRAIELVDRDHRASGSRTAITTRRPWKEERFSSVMRALQPENRVKRLASRRSRVRMASEQLDE